MGTHLIKLLSGQVKFQSDKYPTCPAGKVPLSVSDKTAQPFLWLYAQQRRKVDNEFATDLIAALAIEGYSPDSVLTAFKDTLTILDAQALGRHNIPWV